MQENAWPRVSEEEIESVVAWIRNYLGSDKKAVVGVSGGVDSAVVLHLCVRAVGKERVIPVFLPCGEDMDHPFVRKLLDSCDMRPSWLLFHHIGSTFDATMDAFDDALSKMGQANLQARLRMVFLYAIAGDNNGIVMGTTNRSEYLIGYATKYGDHGVDTEPLQEFFKSEVFEMAKALGVPQEIIDRPPSAGLWAGQTDEDEIGMSYEKLDRLLRSGYESGLRPEDISDHDIDQIMKRCRANEHKKHLPPSYKREA